MFYYEVGKGEVFGKDFEKELHMSLCENGDTIPQTVDGTIFSQDVTLTTDIKVTMDIIQEKLKGCTHLMLYPNGSTVGLIEVLNYCSISEIEVAIIHEDKEIGKVYAQPVF